MDKQKDSTTDGPGMALSMLYEANDLLKFLREYSEDTPQSLTSAQWTQTGQIKERIDAAIAHLDRVVPHPAEKVDGNCQKASNVRAITTGGNYQRVIDLQIQLEEIEGAARLAALACEDGREVGTLSVIERRLAEIRRELDTLITKPPKSVKTGASFKAHDALCDSLLIVDGLRAVCFAGLDGQHRDDVARGLLRNVQGELDQLDKKLNKIDKALLRASA